MGELPRGFIAYIDRMRGVFALLVAFGHSLDIAHYHGPRDAVHRFLMGWRPYLGFVWVLGFIVLSGFCIELSCRRRAGTSTLGQYAALRISRIAPILLLSALFAGAVEYWVLGSPWRPTVWNANIDLWHFWWSLAGLGGFVGVIGGLAPAYTLSYELLYYALWGITRSIFRTWRVNGMIALNVALAVLAIAVAAAGINLPPIISSAFSPIVMLIFLTWLMGVFLVGQVQTFASRLSDRDWLLIAYLVLAIVLYVGWKVFKAPNFTIRPTNILYYFVLGSAFCLLIVAAFHRGDQLQPHALDEHLGLISYPLYMMHGPAIILIGTGLNASGLKLGYGSYVTILMTGALAVSIAATYLVEKPVLAWRARRLSGRRIEAAAARPSHGEVSA